MEEIKEILESNPLTAEDALGRAVILKGHEDAEHGDVLKEDKVDKAGEDEKPEHTVALNVEESLLGRGSHFVAGDCGS